MVNEIRQTITDTCNQNFDSHGGLWDVIKFKIKDLSIRHGKKQKKEKSFVKEFLLKRIENIKKTPDFINDQTLRTDLFEAEAKLSDIILEETRGAITRSRIQWTEQGERSTKYFFGLEKSNANRKSINTLIDTDNNALTDQSVISNHIVEFYQNLYTPTNPDINSINDYVDNSNLEGLDALFSASLDNPINIDEMEMVVKNF